MSQNTSQALEFVTIAKIVGVHGIKGQLKIQTFTESKEDFCNYKTLYWNYNDAWQLMPVVKNSIKNNNNSILLSITDCNDRDLARKYQFTEIAVKRSDLAELEDGQYYWSDLEGLNVYTVYEQDNAQEIYLGVIDHIISTGSNDVLIIENSQDKTKKQHLIPFLLNQYILSIDLSENKMVVDWDPDF